MLKVLIAKLFPTAFPPIVNAAIVADTVNDTIIGFKLYFKRGNYSGGKRCAHT